ATSVLYEAVEQSAAGGDGDGALARLTQAEQSQGLTGPTLARVSLLARLGRRDAGRAVAAALSRDSGEACWNAARAAVALGDQAEARELFDRSLALAEAEG